MLFYHPNATKWLYFFFTFFVVFVIFNVVIAIIMDSYADIKDELEAEKLKEEAEKKKNKEVHIVHKVAPGWCLSTFPILMRWFGPEEKEENDEEDYDKTADNQFVIAQKIDTIMDKVLAIEERMDMMASTEKVAVVVSPSQVSVDTVDRFDMIMKNLFVMNQSIVDMKAVQMAQRGGVPSVPLEKRLDRTLPPLNAIGGGGGQK